MNIQALMKQAQTLQKDMMKVKDEIDNTGIIFYKRPGTFKRIFLILIDAFKKKFNLVKKAN